VAARAAGCPMRSCLHGKTPGAPAGPSAGVATADLPMSASRLIHSCPRLSSSHAPVVRRTGRNPSAPLRSRRVPAPRR
jgi:hypothetical protein